MKYKVGDIVALCRYTVYQTAKITHVSIYTDEGNRYQIKVTSHMDEAAISVNESYILGLHNPLLEALYA